MNNKNKFRTTTDLINFLGIGRPTFYRRAKKLGIETNKQSYSDEEIKLLSQRSTVKQDFKSIKQEEINNNYSVAIITEQIRNSNRIIEQQAKQLDIKDKQISELHNLLDQQQKLTLDLQSRLDNKNKELLDLKETPKKGFWRRLFG
ncbi:replication initiation protein [Lactobacillus gallinarum] [Leuconostoc pseudomesenteroides]|nr:replication initiation protein [Lactobacillus gallinarum] [Leuconostoc pseudomesenteroides]